jgi:hypothetical protein
MRLSLWRSSRPKINISACALVLLLGCCAITTVGRASSIVYHDPLVVTTTSPPAGGVTAGVTTGAIPIIFPEIVGGVMRPAGMPVDHLVTGNWTYAAVVNTTNVNPLLVNGFIPGGTLFDSYFYHFDPGTGGGFYPSSGSVPVEIEFSNNILGVQIFGKADTYLTKPSPVPYKGDGVNNGGTLEDGDDISPFGTAYYSRNVLNRGLETGDSLGITVAGKRIQLAGVAFGGQIDQVRIFVAVPEPASLAMAFIALFGIMGLGRTRSRAVRS